MTLCNQSPSRPKVSASLKLLVVHFSRASLFCWGLPRASFGCARLFVSPDWSVRGFATSKMILRTASPQNSVSAHGRIPSKEHKGSEWPCSKISPVGQAKVPCRTTVQREAGHRDTGTHLTNLAQGLGFTATRLVETTPTNKASLNPNPVGSMPGWPTMLGHQHSLMYSSALRDVGSLGVNDHSGASRSCTPY